MEPPKVAIIILNWNGWKDTIECLESLYQINYLNYDVIVVDNASKDESIEKIKEYVRGEIEVKSKFFTFNPENKPIKMIEYTNEELEFKNADIEKDSTTPSNRKITLIKNDGNYGFSEGNNIAIRYALKFLNPNYVLLLNNDTVVDRNFLLEMVKVAEENEKIGIVGSKIYYYDYERKNNVIWFAGGKINKLSGHTYHEGINNEEKSIHNKTKECEYITGCSMLIRDKLLHQIDGFDKIFFAYYEDVDISIRATNAGWKNVYVPASKIWHKVSKSTSEYNQKISPIKAYYVTRNRIIFMRRNSNRLTYCIFLLYFMTYKHIKRVINFGLLKRDVKLVNSFYRGIIDGICTKI